MQNCEAVGMTDPTDLSLDTRPFEPDIPHGDIVTNSSAAVGWIATQASKSALVAPILSATAKP